MLARSPYSSTSVPPDVGGPPGRVPEFAEQPAGRVRAPTRDQLIYTRELLTVVLLLVAFPWLLRKLLTDPGSVLRAGGVVKSV